MINPVDISTYEVVQILVDNDGVEEELYAKVVSNEGTFLYVAYLVDTSKLYKGACVYQFERKVDVVEFECITEHYPGVINIEEIGLKKINLNMFVRIDDVDDNDSNENIEDMSDDDSEDSFVAPDEPVADLPIDHKEVDEEWDKWNPPSSGARHFKSVIDRLDAEYRNERDNILF